MRLLNKIRVYSNIHVSLLSALHFTHSLLPCTLYRDGDAEEGQIDTYGQQGPWTNHLGGGGVAALFGSNI